MAKICHILVAKPKTTKAKSQWGPKGFAYVSSRTETIDKVKARMEQVLPAEDWEYTIGKTEKPVSSPMFGAIRCQFEGEFGVVELDAWLKTQEPSA